MDERVLKAKLMKLAKIEGIKAVCIALQSEGLSPRQAELLATGDHEGKFRRKTVAAVEAVLAQRDTLRAS